MCFMRGMANKKRVTSELSKQLLEGGHIVDFGNFNNQDLETLTIASEKGAE